MKRTTMLFLVLIPCLVIASDQSPYVGEEVRSIKSLSENEIASLRNGEGMGFAKLAELNHFPGPKHVLDVANELGLSPQQIAETKSLYEEMRRDAVLLGEKIVAAESGLDTDFEQGTISAESLEAALLQIGYLQAQLRNVHLRAHLSQAQLLKPEQIQEYDALRGYGATSQDHNMHSTTHD
jgi:hypothetical protein